MKRKIISEIADHTVRKAEENDVQALIDIQLAALPQSLLAQTGKYFLKKALYPIALNNPDAKAYVITTDTKISGFALYGSTPQLFKQQLSKHKLFLLTSIFLQTGKSFGLLLKCLQTAEKSHTVLKIDPKKQFFHLFLIAVDPLQQGKGIGCQLLNQTLTDSANIYGIDSCLVEARTKQAYDFYKKNGFIDAGHEVRGATKFYKLYKSNLFC